MHTGPELQKVQARQHRTHTTFTRGLVATAGPGSDPCARRLCHQQGFAVCPKQCRAQDRNAMGVTPRAQPPRCARPAPAAPVGGSMRATKWVSQPLTEHEAQEGHTPQSCHPTRCEQTACPDSASSARSAREAVL